MKHVYCIGEHLFKENFKVYFKNTTPYPLLTFQLTPSSGHLCYEIFFFT